jgi:hypothetical protein
MKLYCNAAPIAGALLPFKNDNIVSFAEDLIFTISTPATAAGMRPTFVKVANLPPMLTS